MTGVQEASAAAGFAEEAVSGLLPEEESVLPDPSLAVPSAVLFAPSVESLESVFPEVPPLRSLKSVS